MCTLHIDDDSGILILLMLFFLYIFFFLIFVIRSLLFRFSISLSSLFVSIFFFCLFVFAVFSIRFYLFWVLFGCAYPNMHHWDKCICREQTPIKKKKLKKKEIPLNERINERKKWKNERKVFLFSFKEMNKQTKQRKKIEEMAWMNGLHFFFIKYNRCERVNDIENSEWNGKIRRKKNIQQFSSYNTIYGS